MKLPNLPWQINAGCCALLGLIAAYNLGQEDYVAFALASFGTALNGLVAFVSATEETE